MNIDTNLRLPEFAVNMRASTDRSKGSSLVSNDNVVDKLEFTVFENALEQTSVTRI